MFFEIAGFLFGVAAISLAFLVLYRRNSVRVVTDVYSRWGARQRG